MRSVDFRSVLQLRRFALRVIHSRNGATGVFWVKRRFVYFRLGAKMTDASSKIDVRRLKVGDLLIQILLECKTSLDSSSGTLICPSLCPRHVGRNNYVPLFGVDPIEWRLTRYYVIRDVIVIFEC